MRGGDDTDEPPPMPPLARIAGLLAVAQGVAMLAGLVAAGALASWNEYADWWAWPKSPE